MSDIKGKQKRIIEQFPNSLKELVRPKNFKIIKTEVNESEGNSSKGIEIIRNKIIFNHSVFKNIKSFRVLFFKVVKYVFGSTYSKAKELEQTFDNITKIINITYPVIKTRQKLYGELRKILSSRFGENSRIHKESKKNLSISYEEFEQIEKQAKEKVLERNTEKKAFSKEQVLEVIHNLKNSSDYIDLIILVGITTGSRLIEILRISDYESIIDNPNRIIISGLAKGSGESQKKNLEKKVERPILVITSQGLSEAVKTIRQNVKQETGKLGLNNQELSKKYNERVNRRIKKYKLSGGTSYDLRKIYANLSYELLADQTKITKNGWIMKILGHENLNTSLHYNNVSLLKSDDKSEGPEGSSNENFLDDIVKVTDKILGIQKQDQDQISLSLRGPINIRGHSDDPNSVKFINKNGNNVYISKLPRLKDGNTLVRGKTKITELEEAGIPITNLNLRKLGIGADNADKLMKEMKAYKQSVG